MTARRLITVLAFAVLTTCCLTGCTGCPGTYNVSGRVVDPDGVGIGGVTLSYAGQMTGTTTTGNDGRWNIYGLKGTTTIAFSHDKWYFRPNQLSVTKDQFNLTSMGIPVLTDELRAKFDATHEAVSDLVSDLFDASRPSESLTEIAQQARTIPGVEWVQTYSETLVMEHVDGGIDMWVMDTDLAPPPWAPASHESGNIINLVYGAASSRNLPGNNRAAVIYTADADPGNDFKDDEVARIESLLRNSGYEVDPVRDANAGVGFFQRLHEYGFVFIQSHGGQYQDEDGTEHISIQTGEPVDDRDEPFYERWQEEKLVKVAVDWGAHPDDRQGNERCFWAITDRFVSHSIPTFPDTLLISAACSTLHYEAMANALINRGAQAVVGWTNGSGHGAHSTAELLSRMKSGMSLREAFDDMPAALLHYRSNSEMVFRLRNATADVHLVSEPTDESPTVVILAPLDGASLDTLTIEVRGHISSVDSSTRAILSVNGLSSALELEKDSEADNRYAFSQMVNLDPGENVIQVSASSITGAGSDTVRVSAQVPEQQLWTRLIWNTSGTDIDFHLYPEGSGLWRPDDCYYGRPVQSWGAQLDVDDQNGFGPEHISASSIDDGTYTLAVHYYSSHGVTDPTSAQVLVRTPLAQKSYSRGGFIEPGSRSGTVWEVCRITFPDGHVEDLDHFYVIPYGSRLPHSVDPDTGKIN